jgi:hypothetical protein
MNVGACLPKKRMEDFLALAAAVPGRRFDLYALGYRSREIDKRNVEMGEPVHIVPPVEPEEMLAEYKKHAWLVYTADSERGAVGWPMAVAEAQAAGVGVCFPNLRPDLREYVGDAGFLYDSISEVADIIARPFPEEMRRKGFEQAKKSDVALHKTILTDLWRKARTAARPTANAAAADPVAAVTPWGAGDASLEQRLRQRQTAEALARVIPPGEGSVLLVGDPAQWPGAATISGRPALPFVERDGQYWGAPDDDDAAVAELERVKREGAEFIVFSEPDLWWLDYYVGMGERLRSQFQPILENERVVAFDLRG